MDQNKTLALMRLMTNKIIQDYTNTKSNGIDQDEAADLATMFKNLDQFLSNNGEWPDEWKTK